MDQLWLWIGFNVFVLAMLAVDLFVFHKEAHEVTRVKRRRGASCGSRWRCCSAPASTGSWAATPGWSTSPAT